MQSKEHSNREASGAAPQSPGSSRRNEPPPSLSREEKATVQAFITRLAATGAKRLPAMQALWRRRLAKLDGTWTGLAREWDAQRHSVVLSDGRRFQITQENTIASDITFIFQVTGEQIVGEASIRTDFSSLGIEVVDIVAGHLHHIEFDIIELRLQLRQREGEQRCITFDLTLCDDGDTLEGSYWYRHPDTGKTLRGTVALLKMRAEVTSPQEEVSQAQSTILNGIWEGTGEQQIPEMTLPMDTGQILHIPHGYRFTYAIWARLATSGRRVTGQVTLTLSCVDLGVDHTEIVEGSIDGTFLSPSLLKIYFQNARGDYPLRQADLKLDLNETAQSLEGIYNAAQGLHTQRPFTGHVILKKISAVE